MNGILEKVNIKFHDYDNGAIGVIGGGYSVKEREADKTLWNSTKSDCYSFAKHYLSKNPESFLCIHRLEDRVWICSSSGKIRTNFLEELKGE